jgi:pSer/pThr/pTyr-binding forkhead associated (FHA) protein
MEAEIGLVCGRCESYAPLGTAACVACGHALALEGRAAGAGPASTPGSGPVSSPVSSKAPATQRTPPSRPEPSPGPPLSARSPRPPEIRRRSENKSERPAKLDPRAEPTPAPSNLTSTAAIERITLARDESNPDEPPPRSARGGSGSSPPKSSKQSKSVEELMDQAKNFVCRSCSTPVPMGHKFCGRCGAAVPPEILNARTQFFGQLQAPGKAKLILIRGEGVEGLSYQLNADQHVVGRSGQLVFPDDPFVSPKHANFFYRNNKLVVRDEGSLNGVYLRVRGTVEISPGDFFLAGEQVFQVTATPKLNDQPGPDGTYFYSSPKHQSPFRIIQILQGGAPGMTVCARGPSLQIGREGGDLNFPSDLYMSASHCRLEDQGGKLMLTDLNSRNGSYVRLGPAERELAHGDYLFIGRKLLRVEITAA